MYDSLTGISSNSSQLIIHAPETINTMLVDICAEDNSEQLNNAEKLLIQKNQNNSENII